MARVIFTVVMPPLKRGCAGLGFGFLLELKQAVLKSKLNEDTGDGERVLEMDWS